MRQATTFAALSLLSTAALAQDTPPIGPATLDGVQTHTLTSIDPANDDFADLAPIAEAIGDARVVVLGEQSHGEGPVFLAKARLVKYLHQELGFDVLCWEGSMLGSIIMNPRMTDDTLSNTEAFDGVFPIWTWSAQVQPTLNYARATHDTDRPLEQAGMDAQITSQRVPSELIRRLVEIEDLLRDDEGNEPDALTNGFDALELLSTLQTSRPEIDSLRVASSDLQRLAAFIRETATPAAADRAARNEIELTARTLDDAGWFLQVMISQLEGTPPLENIELFNERDRRMGDNLAWLADEYYAGRKMIVWAATRHAVHRQKEIVIPGPENPYAVMDSMGETAFDELGDDLYTIGFTAGRGSMGSVARDESQPIGEPEEGSIEAALDTIDHPFLFIDFRALAQGHAWRSDQWMRPLGYSWMTAKWPDQFDGLIYIEEMFRSSRDIAVPEGYELTVERDAG
ncbi:MAG: erythromycin esterase family protein [Planctomycetota bacterium]